jgi:hypothetical protein
VKDLMHEIDRALRINYLLLYKGKSDIHCQLETISLNYLSFFAPILITKFDNVDLNSHLVLYDLSAICCSIPILPAWSKKTLPEHSYNNLAMMFSRIDFEKPPS